MPKALSVFENSFYIFIKPAAIFKNILSRPDYAAPLILISLIDLFVFLGSGKISSVVLISIFIPVMIALETSVVYVWSRIRRTQFKFWTLYSAVSLTFFPFVIYHGLNIFIPDLISKLDFGYAMIITGVASAGCNIVKLLSSITIFHLYELYLKGVLIKTFLGVSVMTGFLVFLLLNILTSGFLLEFWGHNT